jgi:hypothetical protein
VVNAKILQEKAREEVKKMESFVQRMGHLIQGMEEEEDVLTKTTREKNERLNPKGFEVAWCKECGDYCEILIGTEAVCGNCEESESEEDEDGFEDCECGFTHHHEDKCPVGDQCRMYERWRDEDEEEEDVEEEDEKTMCDKCDECLEDDEITRGEDGTPYCARCYEYHHREETE